MFPFLTISFDSAFEGLYINAGDMSLASNFFVYRIGGNSFQQISALKDDDGDDELNQSRVSTRYPLLNVLKSGAELLFRDGCIASVVEFLSEVDFSGSSGGGGGKRKAFGAEGCSGSCGISGGRSTGSAGVTGGSCRKCGGVSTGSAGVTGGSCGISGGRSTGSAGGTGGWSAGGRIMGCQEQAKAVKTSLNCLIEDNAARLIDGDGVFALVEALLEA
ncbi:hypothetical protein C3L33_14986, partial [Rhododendron williamsianum]